MKRQHTYEQLIGQKLNGLTPPHVAGLWNNMEAILDREMPQQEKRKRVGGAWWFSANMLIAAGLFASVGTVYTLCRVSGKEPATAVITEVATPQIAKEAIGNKGKEATAKASGSEMASRLQQTPVADQRFSSATPATYGAVSEHKMVLTAAGTEINAAVEQHSAVSEVTTAASQIPVADETGVATLAAGTGEGVITAPLREALPVESTLPSAFDQQPVTAPVAVNVVAGKQKKARFYSDKGFAAGLSLNMPVAVSQQQKVGLDREGKNNQWQDYIPSVYAQLHLNKKFYLQAEWQPVMAQYTPGFTLYNRVDELNPDEKMQKVVKLNKLFYTSLPVSFHYNTPLKNLAVGVGMQYSKTQKIVLQDQEYYHLIQAGGVFDVTELKNEVVVKDPEAVRKHNTGEVVDSVAQSFKRDEWRMLADVNYHFKGLNLGVRYTHGLTNYINTNFTNLPVKDRNESLQLYLRFNLFDSRKK